MGRESDYFVRRADSGIFDHLRIKYTRYWLGDLAFQNIGNSLNAAKSHFIERLTNACNARTGVTIFRNPLIVKTDDGEIFRYAQSHICYAHDDVSGNPVAGAEDGGRPRFGALPHHLLRAAIGERIILEDIEQIIVADGQPVALHGLRIAREPIEIDLFIRVAHEMADSRMALFNQIFHGGLRAFLIVDQELVDGQRLEIVFDQQKRKMHGRQMFDDGLIAVQRTVKDDGVGDAARQKLDILIPCGLFPAETAKEHIAARELHAVLKAANQLCEKRGMQIAQQHGNRTGLSTNERARGVVGEIAQLFDGALNFFPNRRGHVFRAVDDAGNRGQRYAGVLGNFLYCNHEFLFIPLLILHSKLWCKMRTDIVKTLYQGHFSISTLNLQAKTGKSFRIKGKRQARLRLGKSGETGKGKRAKKKEKNRKNRKTDNEEALDRENNAEKRKTNHHDT